MTQTGLSENNGFKADLTRKCGIEQTHVVIARHVNYGIARHVGQSSEK